MLKTFFLNYRLPSFQSCSPYAACVYYVSYTCLKQELLVSLGFRVLTVTH